MSHLLVPAIHTCRTAGGTVIQLGACDDKLTAADTAKLSATAYTGAATYAFIDAIERAGVQQTYGNLLKHMTSTIGSLGKASIKPPSTAGAMVGSALPLVGAIALGPLGLLAGAVAAGGVGESLAGRCRQSSLAFIAVLMIKAVV